MTTCADAYSAPQLESLVVLDPTFFYVEDPSLVDLYVCIVQGRLPDRGRRDPSTSA